METRKVKTGTAAIRGAFKPEKKGDEIGCAYLYANGDIVVRFDRPDGIPGSYRKINYWKIAQGAVTVSKGKGRVVLHDSGLGQAMQMFPRAEWYGPDSCHGSDNTKRLGLSVSGLSMYPEKYNGWSGGIHIVDTSLISSGICVQEDSGALDYTEGRLSDGDPVMAVYSTEGNGER